MEATEYKEICTRPDSFRRSQLEATARVLSSKHPPSAELALTILRQSPIAKPDLHKGDERTDCFSVELNVAQAEQIMEYLIDAEAASVDQKGEATRETGDIADLVDAWLKYIDFRDGLE